MMIQTKNIKMTYDFNFLFTLCLSEYLKNKKCKDYNFPI